MLSCFAKRYDLGCSFWEGGEDKQLHPKTVPSSVSALALVTNRVEAAVWKMEHTAECMQPEGRGKARSIASPREASGRPGCTCEPLKWSAGAACYHGR